MKKKIDYDKFYRDIHVKFPIGIADDIIETLDNCIPKPKCHDAVGDFEHNWKYKDFNETRKCKWCGEKQYLGNWGEWYES